MRNTGQGTKQFFIFLHLLMISTTQNFLIKTIYSPFTSVDTFISVNLLYFCITLGMSKLIIQIFINRIFYHVSMVNGNSKLKYFLLVQEEKKTKNSEWNNLNLVQLWEIIWSLGEGFSETVFGSVLPFQS